MATVEVTEHTFEETVTGEGITLLDFWAEWCPPCKAFGPIFEKASEAHPDITFGKIDTEAEQMLAMQFEIRSIPTIMAVRDGIVVYAQPGALPAKALESLISQVRELDMDEVKAKVKAATEPATPAAPAAASAPEKATAPASDEDDPGLTGEVTTVEPAAESPAAEKPAAKKAPAKKAAAKKTPAPRKAPAKKTGTKKAPGAKKAPAAKATPADAATEE